MRLADTGGSRLSNGSKETPSGPPGGQGSLLDVLAKDKCASVRKGNVSEDACTTSGLSQREPPPLTRPTHTHTPARDSETVPFTTIGYISLAGGTVK